MRDTTMYFVDTDDLDAPAANDLVRAALTCVGDRFHRVDFDLPWLPDAWEPGLLEQVRILQRDLTRSHVDKHNADELYSGQNISSQQVRDALIAFVPHSYFAVFRDASGGVVAEVHDTGSSVILELSPAEIPSVTATVGRDRLISEQQWRAMHPRLRDRVRKLLTR